jgi:hypothetical protein
MIEVAPKSPELGFDEAWLYCVTLTYNNKYDWHMPDYDEYYDCNMNEILNGYGWVDDQYYTLEEAMFGFTNNSVIPVRTNND